MTVLEKSAMTTFKKVVISGDIIEVYEMENPPYQFSEFHERYKSDIEWINEFENEVDTKFDLDPDMQHMLKVSTGKMSSSITRTRNMVRRLILANFDNNSKFVTLTFSENITEVKEANSYFDKFIKRLRRKHENFKYLAVLEFQKRGAVHYHMLSNLPYIKSSELSEIWREGFVKINRISHVDNVGAYVIKYMTKDVMDERLFNNKSYNCSKGLEKPVTLRGELAEEIIKMYISKNDKEVFANSYISEHLGQITYKEYNLKRINSELASIDSVCTKSENNILEVHSDDNR